MKRLFGLLAVLILAVSALGQAAPRSATLAQQKMCADQARRAFKEFYSPSKDGISYDYTSHYDTRANVCYILVHGGGVFRDTGSPSVSNTVFDAFEGRTFASYMWINSENKKYWEVAPMECTVTPRGQEEILCKSSGEFEKLIDKYFGIGR